MAIITIGDTGKIGVIKDLSKHELPPNAWSDAQNIRFLDGYAHQSPGELNIYPTPPNIPQYVFPVTIGESSYWIVLTAANSYAVTSAAGVITYTDITHLTALTGVVNAWTHTILGGIPIINSGDKASKPAYWDLNLTHKFVDLSNWPANTYCYSLRAFKNFLIAMNVQVSSSDYPFMVKWSHPAVPGALPSSWDNTDPTTLAGQLDLAEGYDHVIDGLQLRDAFIVYKQDSTWLMQFIGGIDVFGFRKLFNTGILSRNCVTDFNGLHFVVTRNDIIIHDGANVTSVLEETDRRFFFDDVDQNYLNKVFVTKNQFMNEIYVCYPSLGNTACNKALVYNYNGKTVSFRDLPSTNHANSGFINSDTSGQWNSDTDSWASDATSWAQGNIAAIQTSVVIASSDGKLYHLDGSRLNYAGNIPSVVLERVGLGFGSDEKMKLVKGIRLKVKSDNGGTIIAKVGASNDPYVDPTYSDAMTHTIGDTVTLDCFVHGRYIAVRFESGTALDWRLDSYQIEIEEAGDW